MTYVAILLVFVGITAAIIYAMFIPRISVEKVRHAIDIGVPTGTSRANVRKWVKSQTYVHYSGEIADKETGSVTGIETQIPNSGPLWETPQRIRILFWFKCDKLSHVEVKTDQTPYIFP
jgi:hypothetical protein